MPTPQITNLSATTEIEAINTMLSAIGESPLASDTDLSTATQFDVAMALNILRNTTREVQSMGWKFNTEFGYEVKPSAQFSWTDSDSVTTPLNIFVPPANLVTFSVTKIPDQQAYKEVDTVIRRSRIYQVSSAPAMVFYDRRHARDGFPVADRDFLYINPVWLFAFEDLPESARRYITAKAAREFVQSGVGSDTLSQFVLRNESVALRTLKREQGQEDEYTFLTNLDLYAARGRRPSQPRGFSDSRKNRNFTS